MKKVVNLFLRILGLLALIILCLVAVITFIALDDTKLLGVIFLCAGVWGLLEMGGVVKRAPFRESRVNLILGILGGIGFGIYFLLR